MSKGEAKIGAKLVVDGEKEYKESIAAINKTLSVLSSEAKKTAAAYSDQKGSLEALQAQTEDYNNQAEAQRKKVEILREAYENSKKQLGESAAATQDWLIKLNNAEAALTRTEKAIQSNEEAIEDNKAATEAQKNSTEKYQVALERINYSLSVLESEAKKTTAAYADQKGSLEALRVQTEDYNNQAEAQRKKVETLRDAYENSKKQLGENATATQDWLIKLNNAEAALMKTEKAIEDNEKAIKLQSTAINKVKAQLEEWKDKVEELKEKHPVLTSAMSKTNDAAKKLASGGMKAVAGAAAGTVAGVAAVGTAATVACKELYDAAHQAAQAGDAIDEASQRMGTSAETFQKLEYAAKMSGVQVNTLETAAKKLKSTGSDMDISEAINQVAAIKDESERSAKAIELFGSKAAYEMGPMLSQGAEGIQALKDQAQELGLVMSNEAVAASAAYNDSLDNLTGTFNAVKNNMAAEFLPGVTEIMDGLTALMTGEEGAAEQIKSGVENVISAAEEILPELMGLFTDAGEVAAEVAPELVFTLANGILDNLDEILDAAFQIIENLTAGLLTEDNIKKMVSAALSIVTNLVSFLGDNVDLIINSAFTMIDALIDGLLEDENADKLVTAALDVVTAIVTGLIDNAPEMITGAFSLISALVDALLTYDWWQVAVDIFNGIKDGLKSLVTGEASGSHAGGLDYVPYDGYRAVLHKGEKLLTASEAANYDRQNAGGDRYEELNRKIDALMLKTQRVTNVVIKANGTAGGVVRALKLEVEEEDERSSVFDK